MMIKLFHVSHSMNRGQQKTREGMILSLVLSRSSFDRIISERTHATGTVCMIVLDEISKDPVRDDHTFTYQQMGTNTGPRPEFT